MLFFQYRFNAVQYRIKFFLGFGTEHGDAGIAEIGNAFE